MKRLRVLVFVAVVAIIAVMATVAGASTFESLTWKNVDTNPNGLCGYARGEVNGVEPAPGTDYDIAYGINYYRDIDPCTPGTTNVARNAGDLKVQVAMNCAYFDVNGNHTGEFNVWTGNVKSNAQNTGSVSGHLPWSAYDGSCDSATLEPMLRVIVKSWYLTAFGYVEYDHTTHWVDPRKFH